MTAPILKARVRADIQSRADRILRELGYPEPPLRLEDVCELLRLDRGYFTGESEGLMKLTFSRLKRAGKQLLKRPTLLADAIKKFDLRALYLPDQKRILIDDSIPKPKHRWLEAHEIGHDILPWHHDMMLGDDDLTPTVAVHDKMEAEANFAGGSLIFLGDRFASECKDCVPSIATVQMLKKRYGNTLTTTFWRVIEHAGEEMPIIGMIGQHPNQFHNEKPDFKHIIPSSAFFKQFDIPEIEALKANISSYCFRQRGPLGHGTIILRARDGSRHEFSFETFYNSYDALTLGCYRRELPSLMITAGISI